jgi:hypothetical protein
VQNKRDRKKRSYAEVLRTPQFLTSANRVPVNNQKFSHSRDSRPKYSVFDRITWPHQAKKVLPLSPNICRPLVHFCTKERQIFGDGGSTIQSCSLFSEEFQCASFSGEE